MESLLIFFVAIAILGNIILVWFLIRSRKSASSDDGHGMLMLQRQMQDLSHILDTKVGDMSKQMHDSVKTQFGESQRVIKDTNEQMVKHLTDVAKGVAEAAEASKQVFTIADQLQNLEKVLKHQKQRGNLGEASLELILSNILPATAYKSQYQFSDGEVVDAAIITKEGIIPVDAKFSLDNYNRLINEDDEARKAQLEKDFKNDLKKRIDETAKYIKPHEHTLPFAFMFIPAEGIYYDLLINEVGSVKVNTRSLIDYAYRDKNVIIVSPTTFAAYLQSVLYGFRAFKIEESAKQIGKQVEELSRHLRSYDDYFRKVGNSLGTTVNHYNSAQKELGKIDKDVTRITGSSMDIEAIALEKPDQIESGT
ncbi:MAG TPA: DNA recombination protein RmuC [Candidatus Paceibacterota bacterium]